VEDGAADGSSAGESRSDAVHDCEEEKSKKLLRDDVDFWKTKITLLRKEPAHPRSLPWIRVPSESFGTL
jgi:hypothetical protein